ncbi:mitochondrial dynamin GTPase Msp1 [Polyrhizophydium stewartii]|uniref:Mitochondrial dynamin GTPase Msp1 n=1 Tax=Polyrhizophydium stewartii TaxID=2732419 RepID=A0ABR4NLG8_9FUNG
MFKDLSPTARKFILDVTLLALSQVALYYGVKWVMATVDPMSAKRIEAKSRSSKIMDKLGLTGMKLSEHEEIIAGEIVWPEDLHVKFDDIGGLEPIIDSLRESVIYPLVFPELFSSVSNLLGPPKGVLLYGPPGCGKTMLAKALAKESGATFINMHVSTLTEKWFGESQKLVHALFALAKRLQPTIIFIDEIDSFLRERKSHDHEAVAMMKAEFMTLWDGLASADASRVIVLGATNRPSDLDKAILRRMPKRFAIELPDKAQRAKVLRLLLKRISLEDGFDFDTLATRTQGYSSSDLKELCRDAVMIPVRESIRAVKGDIKDIDLKTVTIRKVGLKDFFSLDSNLFDSGIASEPVDLD